MRNKMIRRMIGFEPALERDIKRDSRQKHISYSQYVRDACREKLERYDRAAAQTAQEEQKA